MNKQDIVNKLTRCIEADLKINIKSPDQDLVGEKVLDSFCMLMLISFIKKEFGVSLNMENLDFDAFTSLNTFADLILKEAGAQSASSR